MVDECRLLAKEFPPSCALYLVIIFESGKAPFRRLELGGAYQIVADVEAVVW